jgi:cobalt-zinc-cadmium efflux system protein
VILAIFASRLCIGRPDGNTAVDFLKNGLAGLPWDVADGDVFVEQGTARQQARSAANMDEHGHAHSHGPSAGYDHRHAPANFGIAFAVGSALNLAFVIVEAIYGLLANSLALLADAGHNFSDVLSLLLAWGAASLSQRAPTRARTYGYKRTSIAASIANAVILLITVGAITLEAVKRLVEPEAAATGTVIVVAAIGIAINGGTALMFMAGRKDDLNVKGAFLHMVTDAATSAGVVVAAVIMWETGWLWLDPAISLAVAAVIIIGTWSLLRDSVNLAMDAVPEGIDRDAIEAYLGALPGVTEIHDLHIWGMSTTETALTVHLVRSSETIDDALIAQVSRELQERFRISHATFQFEGGHPSFPCRLASPHVV